MFAAVAAFALAASVRPALSVVQGEAPEIAIVIDDFGLTYPKNVPDELWMRIPWPVTFAVMPESPRTASAARETLSSGHELLVHFPFDPFLRLSLPPAKASPEDMKKTEALLVKALKEIPGASGLNNHRSFKATQNAPLMAFFMKRLKPTGLFFVDSLVSPRSVAFREARAAGLKAARNFIFLDTAKVHDKAFCEKMLRRAAARAKKTGSVLVIGHHYFWGTYQGLLEEVPRLQAEGFRLVFASALAAEGPFPQGNGAGGGNRTHMSPRDARF